MAQYIAFLCILLYLYFICVFYVRALSLVIFPIFKVFVNEKCFIIKLSLTFTTWNPINRGQELQCYHSTSEWNKKGSQESLRLRPWHGSLYNLFIMVSKTKTTRQQQFCLKKGLVDVRGQSRIATLDPAAKQVMVAQITKHSSHGEYLWGKKAEYNMSSLAWL